MKKKDSLIRNKYEKFNDVDTENYRSKPRGTD